MLPILRHFFAKWSNLPTKWERDAIGHSSSKSLRFSFEPTHIHQESSLSPRNTRVEVIRCEVGIGHDTHRLSDGLPLLLGELKDRAPAAGWSGIPMPNVVCHAVADALLGAAGLGDIGEHYPDTDPQCRGAGQRQAAGRGCGPCRVPGRPGRPANCDVIIHAQEPKLGPHKPAIRANLARLLGLEATAVNVKAKTGEHTGPVGRLGSDRLQ